MTIDVPEIREETILGMDGKKVSFRMIKVEGGDFWMGSEDDDPDALDSEKPIHKVRLSTFWMAEVLVTQAFWIAVMGKNPSYYPGLDRPVEQVSWVNITEQFLPALQKITGGDYRLPTEAEWEYAARGASSSKFKYAGSNRLEDVAWYRGNSHRETKPVGLKQPNALRLYDMNGNVWEWCRDRYDGEYYKTCAKKGVVINPRGPVHSRYRVVRGGSWFISFPGRCRVSFRSYVYSGRADRDIGFRLVVSSWK